MSPVPRSRSGSRFQPFREVGPSLHPASLRHPRALLRIAALGSVVGKAPAGQRSSISSSTVPSLPLRRSWTITTPPGPSPQCASSTVIGRAEPGYLPRPLEASPSCPYKSVFVRARPCPPAVPPLPRSRGQRWAGGEGCPTFGLKRGRGVAVATSRPVFRA